MATPTNNNAISNFDPVAVGDQIAEHLAKADTAVAKHREHSIKAAALLYDVARNHPEHLEAICKRCGLGLSRRKELLMIAGGRKTVEKSKADNKARQRRFRAKKAKKITAQPDKPLHDPVTADRKPGDNINSGVGAEPIQATPAIAAPAQPELDIKPVGKPAGKVEAKKKRRTSDEALSEFKFAAGQWLPGMNPDDRQRSVDYVVAFIERLKQGVAA